MFEIHHRLRTTRLLPPLAGAAAIGIVLAGQTLLTPVQAAQESETAPPVIDITASDFTFAAPDSISAGLVTIRMTNHGQEPHHGQLLRLNEGVTFDELATALAEEGDGALRLVTAEGGPGATDPHGVAQVTLDLQPGQYALACFIPGADGVPHLAKGMLKPIEVTAAAAATTAPLVRDTFTMKDFTFVMPDQLPAGPATYKVVNEGPQIHELNLLKLAPGTTAQDVVAWTRNPSGPPPFEAVGGINAFSQDGAGYMTVVLEPGNYVAVCNVPDPASGAPHSELGMVKEFTVS
jgi:uncharacterized cupredoxin-like copper-binding protein